MGYLGKSINMALVLLIVAIVVIIVSLTMFYQFSLKERTQDFEASSTNLTACNNQLSICKKSSMDAQQKLNSTTQDIRRYDQLYEGKEAELQEPQSSLEDAEDQVANLRLIKTSLESQVTTLQQNIREKEQSISTLAQRINGLEDDVEYYKDKYKCCQSDPEECGSC